MKTGLELNPPLVTIEGRFSISTRGGQCHVIQWNVESVLFVFFRGHSSTRDMFDLSPGSKAHAGQLKCKMGEACFSSFQQSLWSYIRFFGV